jgi:hypothetical protein
MPNITIVTQSGSRLTKQQQTDGTWESAGNIYDADAKTISIDLAELPNLLDSISDNQALILGTSKYTPCKLITADSKAKGVEGITRTKENYSFSDKPAFMLLDIDFKQYPNPDVDVVSMLLQVAKGGFGYVMRGSTTSNIVTPDGIPLEGGNGCHIYVQVKKGTNIPLMLEVINQRLILAGYGFVFISQAGTAEVRTPVDVKVGSPERVIYEASPILLPGYRQHRECEFVAGGMFMITRLSETQLKAMEQIKVQLLEDARPQIDAKKKEWQQARGLTEKQVKEILDRKTLPVDFVISNNDNSTFTVDDVWRDPASYHKKDIRDPIEPEYGKSKAKIYVNRLDDGPIDSIVICSMAHGGDNSYRLLEPIYLMLQGITNDVVPALNGGSGGFEKFALNGRSKEMRLQMLDDTYVMGEMAILGQATIIYMPPNGGKTLITLREIANSVNDGRIEGAKVFYINADDEHKGLVTKLEIAEEYGFRMLAPGHHGFKVEYFIQEITDMVKTDSAKGVVVILDTLKKFTDLMNKNLSSEFNSIIREFVSKGGTAIALAHVNKHQNPDGKNVHAGTTDVKDDFDCVYIGNVLNDLGETKTVEFINEKSRGDVASTAIYEYTKKQRMGYRSMFDSVEVKDSDTSKEAVTLNRKATSARDNEHVIEAIKSQIKAGMNKKTEIIDAVHLAVGETKQSIRKLIDFHTGNLLSQFEYWSCNVGDRNVHVYSINGQPLPPELPKNNEVLSFL